MVSVSDLKILRTVCKRGCWFTFLTELSFNFKYIVVKYLGTRYTCQKENKRVIAKHLYVKLHLYSTIYY